MAENLTLRPEDRFEISPLFRLQWEPSQDAFVLLYPEGIVKLSQSAGDILRRVSEGKSLGETISELEQIYANPTIAPSVRRFLETSYDKGWIRPRSGASA
jgi:pyrroloquinoline quinone biosynthesis protein D